MDASCSNFTRIDYPRSSPPAFRGARPSNRARWRPSMRPRTRAVFSWLASTGDGTSTTSHARPDHPFPSLSTGKIVPIDSLSNPGRNRASTRLKRSVRADTSKGVEKKLPEVDRSKPTCLAAVGAAIHVHPAAMSVRAATKHACVASARPRAVEAGKRLGKTRTGGSRLIAEAHRNDWESRCVQLKPRGTDAKGVWRSRCDERTRIRCSAVHAKAWTYLRGEHGGA